MLWHVGCSMFRYFIARLTLIKNAPIEGQINQLVSEMQRTETKNSKNKYELT